MDDHAKACQLVVESGFSTGHADAELDLVEELVDQLIEQRDELIKLRAFSEVDV